jgi:hypothetical protein
VFFEIRYGFFAVPFKIQHSTMFPLAGANAGIERQHQGERRLAACNRSPALIMITEKSFPVVIHSKPNASVKTERATDAVPWSELFGSNVIIFRAAK